MFQYIYTFFFFKKKGNLYKQCKMTVWFTLNSQRKKKYIKF